MKTIYKYQIPLNVCYGHASYVDITLPKKSKTISVTYYESSPVDVTINLHEENDIVFSKQIELIDTTIMIVPTGVKFSVTPGYDAYIDNILSSISYEERQFNIIPNSISDEYKHIGTIFIDKSMEYYHLYRKVYEFSQNDLK